MTQDNSFPTHLAKELASYWRRNKNEKSATYYDNLAINGFTEGTIVDQAKLAIQKQEHKKLKNILNNAGPELTELDTETQAPHWLEIMKFAAQENDDASLKIMFSNAAIFSYTKEIDETAYTIVEESEDIKDADYSSLFDVYEAAAAIFSYTKEIDETAYTIVEESEDIKDADYSSLFDVYEAAAANDASDAFRAILYETNDNLLDNNVHNALLAALECHGSTKCQAALEEIKQFQQENPILYLLEQTAARIMIKDDESDRGFLERSQNEVEIACSKLDTLMEGKDPNAIINIPDQQSVLMEAMNLGLAEIAEHIIDNHMNDEQLEEALEMVNSNQDNIVHLAVQSGSDELLAKILKHDTAKQYVNDANTTNRTPMEMAADIYKYTAANTIQVLINSVPEVFIAHFATDNTLEILEGIVKENPNILHYINDDGIPFANDLAEEALEEGQPETLRYMLSHEAYDPAISIENGEPHIVTLAAMALQEEQADAFRAIVEVGSQEFPDTLTDDALKACFDEAGASKCLSTFANDTLLEHFQAIAIDNPGDLYEEDDSGLRFANDLAEEALAQGQIQTLGYIMSLDAYNPAFEVNGTKLHIVTLAEEAIKEGNVEAYKAIMFVGRGYHLVPDENNVPYCIGLMEMAAEHGAGEILVDLLEHNTFAENLLSSDADMREALGVARDKALVGLIDATKESFTHSYSESPEAFAAKRNAGFAKFIVLSDAIMQAKGEQTINDPIDTESGQNIVMKALDNDLGVIAFYLVANYINKEGAELQEAATHATDANGNNIFHLAAMAGDAGFIKLALALSGGKEAFLTANNEGKTPVDIIIKSEYAASDESYTYNNYGKVLDVKKYNNHQEEIEGLVKPFLNDMLLSLMLSTQKQEYSFPENETQEEYEARIGSIFANFVNEVNAIMDLKGAGAINDVIDEQHGQNPIMTAIDAGLVNEAEYLIRAYLTNEALQRDAFKVKDAKGNNLAHLAVMTGEEDLIDVVFELKGFMEVLYDENDAGQTALSLTEELDSEFYGVASEGEMENDVFEGNIDAILNTAEVNFDAVPRREGSSNRNDSKRDSMVSQDSEASAASAGSAGTVESDVSSLPHTPPYISNGPKVVFDFPMITGGPAPNNDVPLTGDTGVMV